MLFKSNRKVAAVITVLIIAAAFAVLGLNFNRGYVLTLQDGKTGKVYGKFHLKENDEFSVGFVHSVNKSPVIDVYKVKENKILVIKTIYYGFGAGVQTEIEDGQILTYGDDGSMIVTGFNKEIPRLSYFVGTVSDHILTVGSKEISLRDLCGRNANVCFRLSGTFY